jgi:hypothetical protein
MSRSPKQAKVEAEIQLNTQELAAAIRRSEFYVYAMKKAGYVMQYGTRTTLDHALAWPEANPGFRTTRVYRRREITA